MGKGINNGRGRAKPKQEEEEIDLKQSSIDELYERAEREYGKVTGEQDSRWNAMIAKSGTRKDKITLMGTQIINNPHTSLEKFEQLASWCFDKNHHFSLDACRALTNIYHQFVFADKQSLEVFSDSVQAVIRKSKKKAAVSVADLLGFYLEHHIKHYYGQLVRSLEALLESSVTFVKKTAVDLLMSLTKHKQLRRGIVRTLINKFGDQDLKVVNLVCRELKQQFHQDIQSSSVLLEEAQSFLMRAHLASKSQFYVINFLNSLNMKILNEKGLSKLFELFYHFFEKMVGQQSNSSEDLSSRLFLNSIKGLNRIFGFIKSSNTHTKRLVEQKSEAVYKIVHTTTNTKAKIQLYLFLFQCHSHLHGSLPDRYYRSLYDFLSHDQILHCSLNELFFDLLLVSMKEDSNLNRLLAFLKRLLQLCFMAQANFIATTLILVSNLMEHNQALPVVLKQAQNCMKEEGEQVKYDMNKREPIYAGAQNTLLWELSLLTNHYHPTVRKFASQIINSQSIQYDGSNPLIELSTTSFLEKMVLKKEKKSQAWKLKVKKHLNKIRSSKYETLVDKPAQDFKESEEFIKKYLDQRAQIHTNFKKKQPEDIQEYADEVIEREMQRLNPKGGDLDFLQDRDAEEGGDSDEEMDFEGEDGFEGDENFQGEEFKGEDFSGQDEDLQGDEEEQEEQSAIEGQDFDQEPEEEESEEEREFEEVFNDIGQDSDDYMGKPKAKKGRGGPKRGITKPAKKKKLFKGRGKR